ncbi:MAG: ATP-binding cassette domain-containing protein [Bifidobacteriaceae bacterium]|nr:ATP-binding cassette domain-containing protein [Bifidobacteriaceae bacterium]
MTRPDITIRVEDLDFSFGSKQVLRELSLSATSANRLGVVGESGSGKTTLGRLMVGALAAPPGKVSVNGQEWRQVKRRSQLRASTQMIHQDPFAALNAQLSAFSAVKEAARVTRGLPRKAAVELAANLLDAVGVSLEAARRRPRRLSGGQCQRVAIARALAADPALLVADEPTSSLDISVQAQILNLIREVSRERGLGLVLISHDLGVVRHMTDEVVVMREGRIVEAGRTAEVLSNPKNPYTQKLLADSAPLAAAAAGGPA